MSDETVPTEDREARMAELQKQLDEAQAEQADVQTQLEALPGRFDGSTPLAEDKLASEATEEEIQRAQVVRDPWGSRNALQILRHPPGKRLQWIAPSWREGARGMRGWEVVRHDDAIGRELSKYINDPPSRQEGLAEIGAVVRRGDVVLAWIDEGIFNARRQRASERANRNLQKGANRGQQKFGRYGQSTDDGLTDDENPLYRHKPRTGMISPRRLNEYRQAAVGKAENLQDSRITVQGRRMFDTE